MEEDERIRAHVLSVWREGTGFFAVGGREGMLVLTDRRMAFVHKTEAKMRWWQAVVQRQVVSLIRSRSIMNLHDGYDEKSLVEDLKNKKNVQVPFDDIKKIYAKEEVWGSVLYAEYARDGRVEKYRFSVAQDWVKYPVKDATKFLRVDWKPFIAFIRERQVLVE